MFTVKLLEEATSGTGSVWIPVIVLGWFLIMTLVGWQVSRRSPAAGNEPQAADTSHSGSNPSEFDTH